ncbi:hypothetical protein HJG54_12560 [Leptolyngbya sp. NK1-12]|uniref:Uncharacterized protein n=1 Tax=Leptolyngbya sp. NK1-12 TaxID=2547451 RepID=A0AA96WFE0_9CYAN|nr:hypothetical protein [Leptolyngbya sp. NK1-12]WNZ23600.1 hypothetical protein HJG54_12560 [Leptolyngbya sp. NK1-12]
MLQNPLNLAAEVFAAKPANEHEVVPVDVVWEARKIRLSWVKLLSFDSFQFACHGSSGTRCALVEVSYSSGIAEFAPEP